MHAKVLRKYCGLPAKRIDEFFYFVGEKIYAICQQGGFVICPAGFSRGNPKKIDGCLIWELVPDDKTLKPTQLASKIRKRPKFDYGMIVPQYEEQAYDDFDHNW